MAKKFYLKVETTVGVLTLPFKDIESLDRFTVRFKDANELVDALIGALRLSFKEDDVLNVYLSDNKYNSEKTDDSLPVKYIGNNFNFSSLYEGFVDFLCNDWQRILGHDIRYMKDDGLLQIVNSRVVDRYLIEVAIRRYFGPKSGYKKKRDTYFHILDMSEDGEIEIKNNPFVESTLPEDEFSAFYINEPEVVGPNDNGGFEWKDELAGYLFALSQQARSGNDDAIDNIRSGDIPVLRNLFGGDRPVVDGALTRKQKNGQIILLLEECMEMELSEILKCTNLSRRQTNFGKKRK